MEREHHVHTFFKGIRYLVFPDVSWSKVGLDTYVGDGHTTNSKDFKAPLSGFPTMEGWQLPILYGSQQQKAKIRIYNHQYPSIMADDNEKHGMYIYI